jgi:hypothetical protein
MVTAQRNHCWATMAQEIWNIQSGRSRRWGRRKDPSQRMPEWARYTMLLLLLALGGTFAWEGAARLLHPARKTSPAEISGPVTAGPLTRVVWQRDVASSLEAAARESSAGDITQAEVGIDRAAALVTAAKFRSESAGPDFFEITLTLLDRVVAAAPSNARLTEHATLMRIELAQLRSALDTGPTESHAPKNVAINSPRTITRDSTLDPATLGGNVLDASLMPRSAEILEPPSSRLFVDNVRVENLTLTGATQTIDGIHWRNVMFIGTRLRYQGGEVALQNVHCVRCAFGFADGARSSRLATAIALGQTSVVIE